MSGLAAVWSPRGDAADLLSALTERLQHRGAVQSWQSGPGFAGAGFRRGPVHWAAAGSWTLLVDGRLDEPRALAARLDLPSPSDPGALCLAAWQRWGHAAWDRLRGAWAAVLIHRDAGRVVLARDLVGLRPLCWARLAGGGLAVASEVQALRALPGVGAQPDDWGQACELLGLHHDQEVTAWSGIRRLPAGHVLAWQHGSLRRWRYAWPRPAAVPAARDARDWAAGLRARMLTAVCRCGATDAQLLLSGGLDSAFVGGALTALGARPRALSMAFPGPADEGREQAAMVAHAGLAHRRVAVLAEPIEHDLPALRAQVGSLTWGPIVQLRARLLGAGGVQSGRVFDGHEGDALASAGMGWATSCWRARRPLSAVVAALRLGRVGSLPSWPAALRWALAPAVPPGVLRLARRSDRARHGAYAWSCIDPTWAERIGAAERIAALRPRPEWMRAGEQGLRALMLVAGDVVLGCEVSDVLAARAGALSAHPFLDRDVVEWCLAMPASMSLAGSWTRPVLRQAMRGWVPERVRLRRDKGVLGTPFTAAVAARLRTVPAERDRVPAALSGRVDSERWRGLCGRLRAGCGSYRDAVDWWLVTGMAEA